MKPKIITCALPYANGPFHLGHVLEYIQGDIYARFLRLKGEKVTFLCADDAHGTPIEVNAKKQGKKPEEFVKQFYDLHSEELKHYDISFDCFHTTHSEENKFMTSLIFKRLQEKGYIYKKEMELMYDEKEQRFLPDRYVKGTCPKCGAQDQYGDVCESCGTTYTPRDLINPYSAISKTTPVIRKSEHYFFKLSEFSDKLKEYIESNKKLQPEIKNQILNWIKEGLADWCISRDPPYFGFNVPGDDAKFLYVWLDAPIGYMASLAKYLGDPHKVEEVWNTSETLHIIGKDIVYFHLLFWPAVLMASGFAPADNVAVHGFLTVNKEKMSKSRGTFILAKDFREKTDPEFLRYYFCGSLTPTMTDLDLDLANFSARVNNELVANMANFIYRTLSFLDKHYDGKTSTVLDTRLFEEIRLKAQEAARALEGFNHREYLRIVMEIGSMGNKYFQDNQPWVLVKENKEHCQRILTDAVTIAHILAILVSPIMPQFAQKIKTQLNASPFTWNKIDLNLENHMIGTPAIILEKIEEIIMEQQNPFAKLNLKVAKVISVSEHYKADKLLLVNIDLGGETRQLVAGLKPYYPDTTVLIGKHIVVVSNLEHANLRGEKSEGMLLAAETKDGKAVAVLEAPNSMPGEQVFIDGVTPGSTTITFKDFMNVKIRVDNSKVMFEDKVLKTKKEDVQSSLVSGSVR